MIPCLIFYFPKKSKLKFIYSEKATKFEKEIHFVLTLLSNFKTKWKMSATYLGLLKKLQLL